MGTYICSRSLAVIGLYNSDSVFCEVRSENDETFCRRVRKIPKSDCQLRHVRPSVCMEKLDSNVRDFDENLYIWVLFRNLVEKTQVSLKRKKTTAHIHEDFLHLWQYLAEFLLKWETFPTKDVYKTKNTYLIFRTFFQKTVLFMRSCQKMWWSQTGNTAHAFWMLGNQGYRRTLRVGNTSHFPTATTVSRTPLIITL
jgi:hypothetical protein